MENIVATWIQFVEHHRIAIITSILIFTMASVVYIKDNISVSTDTADMLSKELDWRQLDREYERSFPQFLNNILIVVEAETPDKASDAAQALFKLINADLRYINTIYFPTQLPFFKRSAFLFMEIDELQNLADRLAMIQPFLGTLLNDKSLRGFFNMLADLIKAKQDGKEINIKPLLKEVNQVLENENHQVSWQHLMKPEQNKKTIYREFISIQLIEDNESLIPNEKAIQHIRSLIHSVDLNKQPNTHIKLTGVAALSYEELNSVFNANFYAIIASFILVAFILTLGLGSFRLVAIALLTLVSGLIITTAFATATVGELNLISVAFAVLYIGLGIDFAVHMTLRYREERNANPNNHLALKKAAISIFNPLLLCAITTSIGFYSFLPTDYKGVAELGWISGSGIFISLIITFSLLPAFLSFNGVKQISDTTIKKPHPLLNNLINIPYKYAKLILISTLLLVALLFVEIDNIDFDPNILNLQNPENQSVKTYRDLLQDSDTSPWQGILLEKDKDMAKKEKKEITELTLVDKVVWLDDFVPKNQEEKLLIIDEMNLLMGSLDRNYHKQTVNHNERLYAVKNLKERLNNHTLEKEDKDINQLKQNLNILLKSIDKNSEDKTVLNKIEEQILASFSDSIDNLAEAFNAEEITLNDIPKEVYERWVSQNNHYRLQIYPKADLNDNKAMRSFVKQLQEYNDNIIGLPVINIEASDAVITAFKKALIYAFISITLLLLILSKIKSDAIIILVAVFFGAIFTVGLMLAMNISFNFANIIGLPLLLGIGVDSGIHVTDRFRREQGGQCNIFMTSSSRGVIVSSLTTICSIGNLAFSSHAGTASMGLLLTIGIGSMMISTMVILPAFLIWQATLKHNY